MSALLANQQRPKDEVTRTDILAPLRFFYGLGSESPRVTFIDASTMPKDERWLLVHESDMTPRLADFHQNRITLDVHAKSRIGNYLVRASVLKRQNDEVPVEFGAIGIHLEGFDEVTRELVLSGQIPLGGILHQQKVAHSSHPSGYFQIEIDQRLASLLGAREGQTLYGRCNELRHADGSCLAEVVEVLPGPGA
jgi:chorismate-pyruvate lyase